MGAQHDDADSGLGEHVPGDVAVLVVDDQESFRSALRNLVTATKGFVLVGEAASGEAALGAVEELFPRLVIMDKRMPGMGGIEACRVLTGRHPEIVVVLISVEEDLDSEVLRSSGAAEFISKPTLSPAVLREVWRSHGG
jgi:DNA-binding NarL/FixJ family response regulator